MSHIVEDSAGHMWFGTYGGVSRYDGLVFQSILRRDGLISNNVTDILVRRQGDIWIATRGGVVQYRPRSSPPLIYLDRVVADRVYDTPTSPITLPSSQPFIDFEFKGISYNTRLNQTIYVFRLEGYDDTWRRTRERRIRYSNVPVGEYTFKVKAVDRDLNYSTEPATLQVVIHPAYGQILLTGGLGLSLVGLVLAVGYGINRQRARKEAESARLQAEREQRKAEQSLLQRMQKELEEARQLQLSMLPSQTPVHPQCEIAWYMETATEVGGDYYDYTLAEDGTLTLTLGDATGHGMQAGTVVTATKSLFQTLSHQSSIVEIFAIMSRSLKGMNLRRIGMAMNMVRIKDRTMQISSAGIPPILLYRSSAGQVEEILLEGMPLGFSTLAYYEQREYELAPGDTLLLMSDGLPELLNPDLEEFGYPRVETLFAEVAAEAPEEIIQRLRRNSEEWAAGRPQDDDVTLVVVKVK